jgi:hypothetical protein
MTSFLCTLRSTPTRHLITDLAAKTRRPWQAQERKRSRNSTIMISHLLSPFHDHLDDDYEQDSGTQVMFSSKVDEEDLHGLGSSFSSSVYDRSSCGLR